MRGRMISFISLGWAKEILDLHSSRSKDTFLSLLKSFIESLGFEYFIPDLNTSINQIISLTRFETRLVKNGKILNLMLIVWKVLDGGKNPNFPH